MGLYDDNVIPFDPAATARKVQDRMAQSDYVDRKLNELLEETGALDLDDTTSRQIVKYQSRLLVQNMFEKINMAMSTITPAELSQASIRDRVTLTVGLTGRIETLMKLIEEISAKDGSEMDQFIAKLRSMNREEAIAELRQEFMELFGTLFTDEEREQVFRDLEDQVAISKLGLSSGDNVRSAEDGQEAGSSRWVPRNGPTGVLPPARRTDEVP